MLQGRRKIRWILLSAILMALAGGTTALAAEEAIKSASVSVTSDVEADAGQGDVTAVANSTRYQVTSCNFVNNKSSWVAGEAPRVKIVLEAAEGYFLTISIPAVPRSAAPPTSHLTVATPTIR